MDDQNPQMPPAPEGDAPAGDAPAEGEQTV